MCWILQRQVVVLEEEQARLILLPLPDDKIFLLFGEVIRVWPNFNLDPLICSKTVMGSSENVFQRLQSTSIISSLLRSVFKLFKLGRLDLKINFWLSLAFN